MFRYADLVEWFYLTGSALLSRGPCYLVYAKGGESSGSVIYMKLYDGVDTGGDLKFHTMSSSGAQDQFDGPVPIPFHKGLYASLSEDLNFAIVGIISKDAYDSIKHKRSV